MSISRDTYNDFKNYQRIIQQQGVPLADCDLNENSEIFRQVLRNIVLNIGDGFLYNIDSSFFSGVGNSILKIASGKSIKMFLNSYYVVLGNEKELYDVSTVANGDYVACVDQNNIQEVTITPIEDPSLLNTIQGINFNTANRIGLSIPINVININNLGNKVPLCKITVSNGKISQIVVDTIITGYIIPKFFGHNHSTWLEGKIAASSILNNTITTEKLLDSIITNSKIVNFTIGKEKTNFMSFAYSTSVNNGGAVYFTKGDLSTKEFFKEKRIIIYGAVSAGSNCYFGFWNGYIAYNGNFVPGDAASINLLGNNVISAGSSVDTGWDLQTEEYNGNYYIKLVNGTGLNTQWCYLTSISIN